MQHVQHLDDLHHGLPFGLRQMLTHVVLTCLAISIAFTLPTAAQFVLYTWWPEVHDDSWLFMMTELALAATLVLMFNLARVAWNGKRVQRLHNLAALVHAGERQDWLAQWGMGGTGHPPPVARDILILSTTGREIFHPDNHALRAMLESCYEIRVLLLDPTGETLRLKSTLHEDPAAVLATWRREIRESIAALADVHGPSRKVSLRFYDQPPLWRLVMAGEHVWVQPCHETCAEWDGTGDGEYVFALQRHNPARGLFAGFHAYFMDLWDDLNNWEYDLSGWEDIFGEAALTSDPDPGEPAAATPPRPARRYDDPVEEGEAYAGCETLPWPDVCALLRQTGA